MIISNITRLKNGKYSINIDDKSYEFDEDIVVEYRLVKGSEVNDEILANALNKNRFIEYYHKAINYALGYGKSSNEVIRYLVEKGLSIDESKKIVADIILKGLINDETLAINLVNYYAKKSYGILYIESKLFEKKISKEIIKKAINSIDYDIYYEALNKLYIKAKDKYIGTDFEVKMKIKRYLSQRGYTSDDINNIEG